MRHRPAQARPPRVPPAAQRRAVHGKRRARAGGTPRGTCRAPGLVAVGTLRCRCRSSVVEHSLGKGEAVSSILTGSTSREPYSRRGSCSIWRRRGLGVWPGDRPTSRLGNRSSARAARSRTEALPIIPGLAQVRHAAARGCNAVSPHQTIWCAATPNRSPPVLYANVTDLPGARRRVKPLRAHQEGCSHDQERGSGEQCRT